MTFEQYQFLRYYLPGSLFLIYLGLFLAPFSNIHQASLIVANSNALTSLLALVGGVFVASPVVGYLLYSFYDTFAYNYFAMNWEKRRSLSFLVEWAANTNRLKQIHDVVKNPTPERLHLMKKELKDRIRLKELRSPLKSLVDFLIHSGPRRRALEVKSEEISANLRGYWSHFSARIVCGAIAPILACLVAFVVVLFPYYYFFHNGGVFLPMSVLTPARGFWLIIDSTIIFLISTVALLFPWRFNNPRHEAFELEYFVVKSNIEDADRLYDAARRYFRKRIEEARIRDC